MKKLHLAVAFCLSAHLDGQTYVSIKDFFKDITGMEETTFRTNWDTKTITPLGFPDISAQNKWIQDFSRRAAIFQGQFSFKTVKDLRKETAKPTKSAGAKSSFQILVHDPNEPQITDVRYLMAWHGSKNDTFQVASTLWGPLEGGMAKPTALLTGMTDHPVQGEFVSISTGGATIFRKYFMKPVFLLQQLFPHLHFDGTTRFMLYKNDVTNLKAQPNDSRVELVGVGLHKDVVVSLGQAKDLKVDRSKQSQEQLPIKTHFKDGTWQVDPKNTQLVNLVFTSAYNLGHTRTFPNLDDPPMANFAKLVLQGMYEATIRAAYTFGSEYVNLTLVGASAFRNKMEWISDAINRPELIQFINDSGLKVRLIYRPEPKKTFRNVQDDHTFLLSMLDVYDAINGSNFKNDQQLKKRLSEYLTAAYSASSRASSFNQIDKALIDAITKQLNPESLSFYQPTRPTTPTTPSKPITVTPGKKEPEKPNGKPVTGKPLVDLTNALQALQGTLSTLVTKLRG